MLSEAVNSLKDIMENLIEAAKRSVLSSMKIIRNLQLYLGESIPTKYDKNKILLVYYIKHLRLYLNSQVDKVIKKNM